MSNALYDSSHIDSRRYSESPYAEVRAAVSNTDDPTMPVNTFRMWTIGIFTTLIISAVNQIFAMRCESARDLYRFSPSNSSQILRSTSPCLLLSWLLFHWASFSSVSCQQRNSEHSDILGRSTQALSMSKSTRSSLSWPTSSPAVRTRPMLLQPSVSISTRHGDWDINSFCVFLPS